MIGIWTGIAFGVMISGIGFRIYYTKKEKRLFAHLQKLLEDAINGTYEVSEISEEKVSLFESSFKRYLDGSRISEEQQKAQKEMIQTLISDIAHQTLTPISNLKLYAELLEEMYGEDAQIKTISEETGKLDFLVQSLVKLSRMENGIIAVHPKEMPLPELLMTIQKMYQKKAEQKKLIFTGAEAKDKAVFDLKWTMEAIGNIVDNAIKYTPSGGSVTIGGQKYSFFVKIMISDTGIGIAEEEIPKIFTRFYRSFDVAEMPGVGIGLYLARYIIEQQKGYIRVESKKGKGSEFLVFLPIATIH